MSENECLFLNTSHRDILLHLADQRYEGIPDILIFNIIIVVGLLTIVFFICPEATPYRSRTLYFRYIVDSGKIIVRYISFLFSKEWLLLKPDHMTLKYGRMGYQVLRYQRYLIIALSMMSFINVAVVMPINIRGGSINRFNEFRASTLSNLGPRSPFVWTHVFVGVVHTIIVVILMRKFSRKLNLSGLDCPEGRLTLFLKNLPNALTDENSLKEWFAKTYPWTDINHVHFVYDIQKIENLEKSLRRIDKVLMICDETDKTFRIPKCMGCFLGDGKNSAISFYEEKRLKLLEKIEIERNQSFKRGPVDWAFVTFAKPYHSKFILQCEKYKVIKTKDWEILPTPSKDDIEWRNFQNRVSIMFRGSLVNLVVFGIFCLFTTPQIVMNNIKDIGALLLNKHTVNVPTFVEIYIPPILMSIIGKALIFFVISSARLVGKITQTQINKSILIRGTVFQIIIVLILPAFGSLSIESALLLYFNVMIKGNIQNDENRWQCIFLAQSGIFFIDYLITNAFLGNIFQLEKAQGILRFILNLLRSASWKEVKVRNLEGAGKVWFGQNYVFYIVHFFIGASLGVSCPLITPFALLYLIIRHLVDTYNLQCKYSQTMINADFYLSTIEFPIAGTLFQQFFTTLFLIIKSNGEEHYLAVEMISALILMFFLFFFFLEVTFKWQKPFTLAFDTNPYVPDR